MFGANGPPCDQPRCRSDHEAMPRRSVRWNRLKGACAPIAGNVRTQRRRSTCKSRSSIALSLRERVGVRGCWICAQLSAPYPQQGYEWSVVKRVINRDACATTKQWLVAQFANRWLFFLRLRQRSSRLPSRLRVRRKNRVKDGGGFEATTPGATF